MFSGIIQSVGTIATVDIRDEKGRLTVGTPGDFGGFQLGESIAVNGVCLTVVSFSGNSFVVDMSTETLNRTSFKQARVNSKVNLERSLTLNQKISGHFVMGHVDQVGTVVEIVRRSGETLFRFEHPRELQPHIIEKGSMAVDGISLTVFECRDNRFTVSIIPYTLEHTNLRTREIGDKVNLECDMIGKYVYRACEAILGSAPKEQGINPDLLKQHGFV